MFFDQLWLFKERTRKDGILEYTINRENEILEFLALVRPYLILKRRQAELMVRIIKKKKQIKTKDDFTELIQMVDRYREINYSQNRKRHNLTP